VVIGAGVLGVALGARLAESAGAAAAVTLLEQNRPGHAATRSSFAWLNANQKLPRAYHDLNHAGLRAWSALAERLGRPDWYRPSGNLEWARTPDAAAELTARVTRLAEWGYPAHLISAAAAAELEPSLRWPATAAAVAWFPEEGYLLTEPMVAGLAARAARHGATVLTGTPGHVTGLDVADGVVRAVRTSAGQVIPADVVVCCAGRWVPELPRWPARTPRSRWSRGSRREPKPRAWWSRPARWARPHRARHPGCPGWCTPPTCTSARTPPARCTWKLPTCTPTCTPESPPWATWPASCYAGPSASPASWTRPR
jgi:glycine/D-amino acid oxidase-like deaminating enzyme